MFIFFILFFLVCVLWAFYVGKSLMAKLRPPHPGIIRGIILFAGGIFPLDLLYRMLPREYPILVPFFWYAKIGMGFIFILGSLLLVWDTGRFFHRLWVKFPFPKIRRPKIQKEKTDVDRREFIKKAVATGTVGFSATAAGYGLYQALKQPDVKTIPIPVKGLAPGLEGFSLALLTDIHINTPEKKEWLDTLVKRVNALNPHAIALAGDLADGRGEDLMESVSGLEKLFAPHGKFFVTGNHEYYSDLDGWLNRVKELGFTLLMNTHGIITHNGCRILMGGVTDYSAGRIRIDHASRPDLACATREDVDYKILLAHQPKSIFKAAKAGFDLQLSGHTHGGQIIPFNFLTALDQPYLEGLHTFAKTQIYVSRGAGYWGPPIRWGAPSEISQIILTQG